MSKGHGQIINLGSGVPWIFTYNPGNIKSKKPVTWFSSPNIGGAFKKKFFTGFDNKEVTFQLKTIDMESPLGVLPAINYFEQLREPDAGIIGIAGSFFGNQNYPPPQVLFQFGVSMIPLVWDVLDVSIEESNFDDDKVGGIVGVPRVATFDMTLSLDEDSVLFKANQIARKASATAGGIKSIQNESLSNRRGSRKEIPGANPKPRLNR